MTRKQARFVEEYVPTNNATEAAIKAGYSKKTAYSMGPRLLKHVQVVAAIEKRQAERLKEEGVGPNDFVRGVAVQLKRDTRQLYDSNGNLKPIHTLTRDQASWIESWRTHKQNLTSGDGKQDKVVDVRLVSIVKILEFAGNMTGRLKPDFHLHAHLGSFEDKRARLSAGRAHVEKQAEPEPEPETIEAEVIPPVAV